MSKDTNLKNHDITASTGNILSDVVSDEYQERYLAHQQHGKKEELITLMKERHSNRRFDDQPVDENTIQEIIDSTKLCPSSCDRHGVRIKVITQRDQKALLNGLLVGGVGWIYRAPIVFLLFADYQAYKGGDNGDEINYNALLDAGVMLQQMSLMAASLGLHSAFCNPQVRPDNRDFFYKTFKPKAWDEALFCGALALGYPHNDPIAKTRNPIENMRVD